MTDRIDVFVVDDDPLFRDEVAYILRNEEISAEYFGSITECRAALARKSPLVILLDIQLPDGNGVGFLRELVAEGEHSEVVVVSGAASLQDAADSIKIGAADFLEKPFQPERLLSVVQNTLRYAKLKRSRRRLISAKLTEYEIVGESSAILRLREMIDKLAGTDMSVLITGESGTGKELVAGQMHYRSARADAPYVRLNCSAIPGDLFESELFGHTKGAFTGALSDRAGRFSEANEGTLLLDEIGDMPLSMQPKLLRTLESGEFSLVGSSGVVTADVRVISSTNHNLKEAVSKKMFREDLFYRISGATIEIPPLRSRKEDIPLLAHHFWSGLVKKNPGAARQLTGSGISALVDYEWPGNVRQLKHALERVFFLGSSDEVAAHDIRAQFGPGEQPDDTAAESGKNLLSYATEMFERSYLRTELERADQNVARLAEILKMDRGNLYKKLKKLGLL